ncbi:MAG: GNAT family N-acetyltransferase [Bacteroidetes bacterium]|nr:GNAT family N-acetyltransferase [Bacteroidota bacterium]
MERFDYTPPSSLNVLPIPGLAIEEVSMDALDRIREMNRTIFREKRIINTFEREDVMILEARVHGESAGFKVGYRENRFTFYSAKGGVLPAFRRRGIAVALLDAMMGRAKDRGYIRFAFDTFPNLHPGMTILALEQGFQLVKSDFNSLYREYRLRFERKLQEGPEQDVNPAGV